MLQDRESLVLEHRIQLDERLVWNVGTSPALELDVLPVLVLGQLLVSQVGSLDM